VATCFAHRSVRPHRQFADEGARATLTNEGVAVFGSKGRLVPTLASSERTRTWGTVIFLFILSICSFFLFVIVVAYAIGLIGD
jgi:hypothetical protein